MYRIVYFCYNLFFQIDFLLGKLNKSRLKLVKKEPGTTIGYPSDFRHTITVQHTVDPKTIAGVITPHSPPGSPAIPRLRAIARK